MKRRLRVAQLIDGFATAEASGGAALFAIQMMRHLPSEQFERVIYGLWRYNTASEARWLRLLAEEGIETHILIEHPHELKRDLFRAAQYLGLSHIQQNIDICNSHFDRGDVLQVWLKLVFSHSPKLVRTVHGGQNWLKRPWAGIVMNTLFPRFYAAETAISTATKTRLDKRWSSRLSKRQAIIIHNGLSSDLLADAAQSSKARSAYPSRFGIIGRLEQEKGHTYFLEAAALVYEQYPETEFWVIGAGSLEAQLRQQAWTLGLEKVVVFLGARNDVPHLLRQLDCVVSASLAEGFPTIVLEAMVARVPVIASDTLGSREILAVPQAGVLVQIGNSQDLATAMIRLIMQPERIPPMVERAWHHVQRYTMTVTATAYAQLYQRIGA